MKAMGTFGKEAGPPVDMVRRGVAGAGAIERKSTRGEIARPQRQRGKRGRLAGDRNGYI